MSAQVDMVALVLGVTTAIALVAVTATVWLPRTTALVRASVLRWQTRHCTSFEYMRYSSIVHCSCALAGQRCLMIPDQLAAMLTALTAGARSDAPIFTDERQAIHCDRRNDERSMVWLPRRSHIPLPHVRRVLPAGRRRAVRVVQRHQGGSRGWRAHRKRHGLRAVRRAGHLHAARRARAHR